MFMSPIRTEELSSVRCFQSPYWASLKGKHGWKADAFRLPHSTLLVLTRTFFHFFTLAYVPFGPLEPVALSELSRTFLKYLPKGTFAIRYDLPYGCSCDTKGAIVQRESVQPDASVLIDLTGGYAQVRSAYHERARRQLKKSAGKVTVEEWDGSDDRFELFYRLYEKTGVRDGFSTRSRSYIRDVLAPSGGETKSKLFLAFRGRTLVGGTILLYSKSEGIYLFGASERMSDCTASHALQDAMIRFCCEEEIPLYDLFGVSGKDGRGVHLKSLDLFKTSFGGETVYRQPTMDYPLKPLLYRLFTFAEWVRYTRARGL